MVHSFGNVTGGTIPKTRMAIDERYVYLSVLYDRYHAADRRGRGALLAEMAAVTDMHVKSLTRLVRRPPCRHLRKKQRSRTYGPKVDDLVRVVDRALDHPCRERLQPMLACMTDHLRALGRVNFTPETRQQIEATSVSTMGRIKVWRRHSLQNSSLPQSGQSLR